MDTFTVDTSFSLKENLMVCQTITDSDALRIVDKVTTHTYLATDKNGLLAVAWYAGQYRIIYGNINGWYIII